MVQETHNWLAAITPESPGLCKDHVGIGTPRGGTKWVSHDPRRVNTPESSQPSQGLVGKGKGKVLQHLQLIQL